MRDSTLKTIEEYQNKVEYLENKLEKIVKTIENLIIGDYEKAKNVLVNYKESTERFFTGRPYRKIIKQFNLFKKHGR